MAQQPKRGEARAIRSPEEAFGASLRVLREQVSISQETLAAEGGYHRTYIGQLERGEKSPSLRTIFALAQVLKVQPSDLLRSTELALDQR
ncbi:helix-turn-helix domain-containing protein [Terriglobus saanensis]|uniref:Helix-turn-helix domain protein n=1 Tax=Terriglobus saanensis (strain ATCC BAA-1853 / DSM 23119 / SP1PR4) TaxID=401053 RepID=E8UZ21_TERSS|nr:helix-turn-helix domain protein [Terriglobus saanensis SP1PR4]